LKDQLGDRVGFSYSPRAASCHADPQDPVAPQDPNAKLFVRLGNNREEVATTRACVKNWESANADSWCEPFSPERS